MRPRPPLPLLLAVSALFLVLAPSCGYSTKRLDAFGGRSIAVLPFENLTFRRGLEMELTEQVLIELRARTSYAIATPATADYVLEGTLTAGESVALQRSNRSVVQERYRGTAQVTLKDRRSGRVLRTFQAYAVTEYTPDAGGESLLGSATRSMTRRLAIRIVQGLEAGF